MLKKWKEEGHRTLVFSQGTQMLDIIEGFVVQEGYHYLRMDGGTAITQRKNLIDRFNNDENIFLFLLTTKVYPL